MLTLPVYEGLII